MFTMSRKKSASKRLNVDMGEGTGQVPPVNVGESKSQSEALSQTSQTPSDPEEPRGVVVPLVPPLDALD